MFVAFDIEATGPLAPMSQCCHLLGIGMVIAPDSLAGEARQLSLAIGSRSAQESITPARSSAAQLLEGNSLTPAFALLEALAWADASEVSLALGPDTALKVQVQ